ncbi:acVLRF1 family peptidyl-tRNA hydrolase [Nocardioides sp. CN2-186]|uniref:acVLRF1 family peptidyl-tRNA hydrolase n=1 Tax=Nocardioides tweenelious TaxID=3156607 RepID=UPI0032B588CD
MTLVLVPSARLARWVENFTTSHGETELTTTDGALSGTAEDGSTFSARLPFGEAYAGPPDPAAFAEGISVPDDWGILLVRKGGFAIARMSGTTFAESKVGQRHVQGRTKAGGQSQQRFARRRDNQARQAYEAAAEHAARILGEGLDKSDQRRTVVTGGDHAAVDEVLADVRLKSLTVVEPWLAVPDPRRGVLEQAALDARSARVEVHNS